MRWRDTRASEAAKQMGCAKGRWSFALTFLVLLLPPPPFFAFPGSP
jgi:hypothetical protein